MSAFLLLSSMPINSKAETAYGTITRIDSEKFELTFDKNSIDSCSNNNVNRHVDKDEIMDLFS